MAPRTAKHELPQGIHCFSGSNYKTGAIPIFQREFCCGAGGSEIGADRHPSCHGSCVRNRRSLDALEGLSIRPRRLTLAPSDPAARAYATGDIILDPVVDALDTIYRFAAIYPSPLGAEGFSNYVQPGPPRQLYVPRQESWSLSTRAMLAFGVVPRKISMTTATGPSATKIVGR